MAVSGVLNSRYSPVPAQTQAFIYPLKWGLSQILVDSHIAFPSSIPQLNSSPGHPLTPTVNNLATLSNFSQCWDYLEEEQECIGHILLLTFPVTTEK